MISILPALDAKSVDMRLVSNAPVAPVELVELLVAPFVFSVSMRYALRSDSSVPMR